VTPASLLAVLVWKGLAWLSSTQALLRIAAIAADQGSRCGSSVEERENDMSGQVCSLEVPCRR
jgi:hypothetical protein